jgi:hypothetical protein
VVEPESLTTTVALGLSYEKLLVKEPAWPCAAADIVSARPNPTLTKHFELESDTYMEVTQGSEEMVSVGIMLLKPNPEPKKATKIPPKTGAWGGCKDDNVGTLKENAFDKAQT